MTTATITSALRAWDGVYLLRAHCDACGTSVTHGAGHDLAALHRFLGHRTAHCPCGDGYLLQDPDGVLDAFTADPAATARARRP